MKCPFCAHDETQVIDSRNMDEGRSVRRRRRCVQCDKRFTTYEHVELIFPMVIKRDGNRIEFNVQKLRASMMLALRKRPVSTELLDKALTDIQDALLLSGLREIPSETIGEYVLHELRALDKVAYVRFASVYKKFEDVDEFADVIREMGH